MNDPFSVSGMSPQSFGNLNPGFGSPPGFGPSPGLTPVNPAFEAGDEFRLAPAPEPMYSPPAPNPYHAPQHGYTPSYSSGGGGVAWGKVGSGAGMMLLAVVWFVGGLAAGYIFFYPPILLIIGLVTMITGLCGSSD